jgi:hypothetical protein
MTDNSFQTLQEGVVATYSKYLRRILEAETSRSQNIGTKYPVPYVTSQKNGDHNLILFSITLTD